MDRGGDISYVGRFEVRRMLSSDLDSVLKIEELSFTHPWSRKQFLAEMERGSVSHCHVAVVDDEKEQCAHNPETGGETVLGFIMALLVLDELHITNLAVAPMARKRGVAAGLLEKSMRRAMEMGATWCQLEVRCSNKPARQLYRRFGFKTMGMRKGYYSNGEDAVVMGKDLTVR